MEFSFSADRRLLSAAEYSRIFQQKSYKAGDTAFLLLVAKSGSDQARLGLAISKKQLRRAVDRNRVKRICRESFRYHQQQLAGLDLVVLCRSGAVGLDKQKIRNKLDTLFDKIAKNFTQ